MTRPAIRSDVAAAGEGKMTAMARRNATGCAVCRHPDREAINSALASDAVTVRGAAERWHLDRSAVWRHRHRHLPLALAKAAEAASVASAGREYWKRSSWCAHWPVA